MARDQLSRWVAALPSPSYDIAVVPVLPEAGPVQRRRYSAPELIGALAWLRRENLRAHVYARPAATRHVLIDDLDSVTLSQLRRGHRVAAIVETSVMNFQAWVSVSADPVPTALATAAAQILAARFAGDPGSADARHCGRAVGFTNRKPMHEEDRAGRFPWVHLRTASAGVCPNGAALLAEAQARLDAGRVAAAAAPVMGPAGRLSLDGAALAAARWRLGFAALLPVGYRLDRSRLDFGVAVHLLRAGAAPAVVAEVLGNGERAAEMPTIRREAYVRRTLEAARRVGKGVRS